MDLQERAVLNHKAMSKHKRHYHYLWQNLYNPESNRTNAEKRVVAFFLTEAKDIKLLESRITRAAISSDETVHTFL